VNNKYQQYIEKKSREYGQKFDASDLDERFIRFYHTGQRIKIRTRCGTILTGTVSATTGWRPCFLLMRTVRSIGSPWTLGSGDEILAVKHGTKYIPYQREAV
jgi:hypothetical protein